MKPGRKSRSRDETPKASAAGPSGHVPTRADLPSPLTKRWVSRRKAEVVAGVRAGLIALDEALKTYGLSLEEYRSWERLFGEYGLDGLRATRIKKYRDRERRTVAAKIKPAGH